MLGAGIGAPFSTTDDARPILAGLRLGRRHPPAPRDPVTVPRLFVELAGAPTAWAGGAGLGWRY